MSERRSLCPINLTLELLGDRWSLLIVRDVMFADKRHFRELLQSADGIFTNVLAERLGRLVDAGDLRKSSDSSHKQKTIYSLTETGIDLLPVLAQLARWGRRHMPVTPECGAHAGSLEAGGSALLDDLRTKLRLEHLDPV